MSAECKKPMCANGCMIPQNCPEQQDSRAHCAVATGSAGWTDVAPKEDGFYWLRANGGTEVIGYWNAWQGKLQLCGQLSCYWRERADAKDRLLTDQGIEFLPEKLSLPNTAVSQPGQPLPKSSNSSAHP